MARPRSPRAPKAPAPPAPPAPSALVYRYPETRKNIPPAGLAAEGRIAEKPQARYAYDPHRPPVLRYDAGGGSDHIQELLETARSRALSASEVAQLAAALQSHQPWLEWSGKREQLDFLVDAAPIHLHERVSAQAILAVARRQPLQRALFADPQFAYHEAVRFYEHEMEWANRLILGDSLTVMHSLAQREELAGKVQMIYIDPPYGIKFASNFQPFVGKREVKDREQDLTREPEVVKAYRDTWTLGVHSYLTYLRDRLTVARTLLADTGSIFVQIGDENVHRVRALMDEVFGVENLVSQIVLKTTSGAGSPSEGTLTLAGVSDYLLWYCKDKLQIKYHQPYMDKLALATGGELYQLLHLQNGVQRRMSVDERQNPDLIPQDARRFRPDNLTSQSSPDSATFAVPIHDKAIKPGKGGWKTNLVGMQRLVRSERLWITENDSLQYIRFLDDFPVAPINNVWTDVGTGSFTDEKVYVVQTNVKIVSRCLLMTTDPGDLVLDPTCGSGTTAYVAEQWGRRWITIDASRVALALARQRLLTAQFVYYKPEQPDAPLHPERNRFIYRTVPHITLKSIAQNTALDPIFARWEPALTEALAALNAALAHVPPTLRTRLAQKLAAKEKAEGKKSITEADRRRWLLPAAPWPEWEAPFDADEEWPEPLRAALAAWRAAWRQKMDEVNACIQANAEPEPLVDQPETVKGVVRVSGPFSVEGLQPAAQTLDMEAGFGGAPDDLESFPDDGRAQAANADAYLTTLIRLLRQDGVRFPNNQQATFAALDPLPGSILHAEGRWSAESGGSGEESERRVAVVFGPQYGPVTAKQVEDSLRAARRAGYDDLVVAGFAFDAAAQATLHSDPNPDVRCHMAGIRPDINMDGLLKTTPNSQLFTVFGLPRVSATRTPEGDWVVEMEGVDIYDPVDNTVQSTGAEKVAAWFLDGDYDGRTFCITQAFFPDKSAWEKLAKALKSIVEPERFAAFAGTRSLPFPAGEQRRAAVKVVDPRGNEVLSVIDLADEVRYG